MEHGFNDVLKKLITEQGREALLNPSKCKALLADYTRGEYKKESRLLLQALEAGAAKAIDIAEDTALCKKQQVKLLREEYFMAEDAAADVVDTLALALRGEEKEKVRCKNCGKELLDEWKACPYCATLVDGRGAGPEIQPGLTTRTEPDIDALLETGRKYLESDDYDNAITRFDEAIRLYPGDPNAYLNRGDAYAAKRQRDAAIRDYSEVIRLDPDNSNAYAGRGEAFSKSGQKNKAIQDLEKALSLDPNHKSARDVLKLINDPLKDKIIKEATNDIGYNPTDFDAYFRRGFAYFEKNQYDTAIENYNEFIRINMKDPAVCAYRGRAHMEKGQYDMALKDFDDAIRLRPNYAWAYAQRGEAYWQLGEKNKAIQDLETAIGLEPTLEKTRQTLQRRRGY